MSRALVRNSVWSLIGQAVRIVAQIVLFILLARAFGPSDFGLFEVLLAICQICFPFSGLGSHNLLVMRVARDRSLVGRYATHILLLVMTVGVLATLSIWGVFELANADTNAKSWWSILALVATELIAYRVLDIPAHIYQAFETIGRLALVRAGLPFMRAAVASVLFGVGSLTFQAWALVNLVLTVVIAMISLVHVTYIMHIRWRPMHIMFGEIANGLRFAGTGLSQAIYTNIDKFMVAQFISLATAGGYAAAFRVFRVAFLPIMAVLQTTYPRYFVRGGNSIAQALKFSKQLAPFFMIYSFASGVILYFTATLLPFFLGAAYKSAVPLVQMFSFLPLIQCLHYLLGEVLTGASYQGQRLKAMIATACLNIILNVFLIPIIGSRGAILATILGETALIVMYAVYIACNLIHEREACSQ